MNLPPQFDFAELLKAHSQLNTANVSDDIWDKVLPPIDGQTNQTLDYVINDQISFFQFMAGGVLVTTIGLLGLIGNIMSIVVLSRPQMRSSINCCLIGLASFDILVLLSSFVMFGIRDLCLYLEVWPAYSQLFYPVLIPLFFPLGLTAQTGSVWVTVAVTLERFVAVCHPLEAKSLCTYGRAKIYIIVITAFSILYNLPRFWEVTRVLRVYQDSNETYWDIQPSALRENEFYIKVYINWMYLFVMYFIPFLTLAILNSIIYRRVRTANIERAKLSRSEKRELKMAVMLFCVVVVFFICNILALIVNILEVAGIIFDNLTAASNLLVTVNSSVNFIIYCIFGQKFRRILIRVVCIDCCGFEQESANLEESMYPMEAKTFYTTTANGSNGLSRRESVNNYRRSVKRYNSVRNSGFSPKNSMRT